MMTEVLRDRRVQVSELELHYVEGPDAGPPIVFMHGITARWQAWASVIPAFLEAWHVFAVDLRGSGESGWTPGEYGFAGPARDIAEFLRDVIPQPAVLVGHSWGAVTAAQVAADAPHAVRAIVLEDPPLYPQSESALAPFRALDTLLRGQPTAGALGRRGSTADAAGVRHGCRGAHGVAGSPGPDDPHGHADRRASL